MRLCVQHSENSGQRKVLGGTFIVVWSPSAPATWHLILPIDSKSCVMATGTKLVSVAYNQRMRMHWQLNFLVGWNCMHNFHFKYVAALCLASLKEEK